MCEGEERRGGEGIGREGVVVDFFFPSLLVQCHLGFFGEDFANFQAGRRLTEAVCVCVCVCMLCVCV